MKLSTTNLFVNLVITLSVIAVIGGAVSAQYTPPGWAPVVNVSNTPAYWDVNVSYDFDSNGKIHAFFEVDWQYVYYATNASGTWVNTLLINQAVAPHVVITPDQIIHLVYKNKSNGGLMYTSKPVTGGSWSAPANIGDQTNNQGLPQDMIMDASGGIYLVWVVLWNDNLNPRSSLWGRYKPYQGSWGNTELVVGINHKDDWPMGAWLSTYNMTIWCNYEMTGSNRPNMTYKVRPPGGPWSAEYQVPHVEGSTGGAFCFSPSGEMACTFARNIKPEGEEGLDWEVFAIFSNNFGASWTPEFNVSNSNWLSRGAIGMTYDSDNNFHMTWQRASYDGDDFDEIYRARIGGVWQAEQNLSNSPNAKFTGSSNHALKARGRDIHFMYVDNDSILIPNGTGEYYYLFKQGSTDYVPPAAPNPFTATAGEKRIQLNWINPPDPDLSMIMVRRSSTGYPAGPYSGTYVHTTPAAPSAAGSYLDYPLAVGTTQYYSAFAMDSSGNWSPAANAVATPVADTHAPAPVSAFAAVPYTTNNISLSWQNPPDVDFKGTRVIYKTTGFPTGPTDGTVVCDKLNSPGSSDSYLHSNLTPGQTYYYAAFAYDYEPNYATGAQASGTPVYLTCGLAKQRADNQYTELTGKVVTGVFNTEGSIYIQEPDKSSGIRVPYSGSSIAVGDIVNVSGPIASRTMNGVAAERTFAYATVTKISTGAAPVPLEMNCRSLGGAPIGLQAGVLNGVGLNNLAMLVRIHGKVTYVTGQYFYVDDGSNVQNVIGLDTPVIGVMVKGPSSPAPVSVGQIVKVTGVSQASVPSGWTTNRSFMQCRTWSDVTILAGAPLGIISGVVKDASNNPIPGAAVSTNVGGYSTTSAADGTYSISSVNPGAYNVTASKAGYSPQTISGVNVTAYNTSTVNFTLVATDGSISGTVKDQWNAGVSGASVTTSPGGYTATTGAGGTYSIPVVAPGSYTVTASRSGYANGSQGGVVVNAGTNTVVNLTIVAQPGSISGRVTDANSNPISQATVSTNTGGYTTSTAADGTYTLSNVTPGTYNVSASKAGYLTGTQNGVTVAPGQAVANINFALQLTPGTITGIVRDNAGNPLVGATVSTNTGGYTATSGSGGVYSISAAPGTYNVTASKNGYLPQTVNSVSVASASSTTVDFSLIPNVGTISGFVRDLSNNPISGATVSTNAGGYSTSSAADGSYSLTNVAAGSYNVTASKTGYSSQTASNVSVTAQNTTTVNFNLAVPVEKLLNGSFEGGFFSFWGGKMANSWGATFKDSNSANATDWDSYNAGGSYGMVQEIFIDKPGSGESGIVQQVSGLTPGANYKLSAYGYQVQGGYTLKMAVDPNGGTALPVGGGVAFPSGAGTWKYQEISGTVGSSGIVTVFLWVLHGYNPSGDCYFNNASLLVW